MDLDLGRPRGVWHARGIVAKPQRGLGLRPNRPGAVGGAAVRAYERSCDCRQERRLIRISQLALVAILIAFTVGATDSSARFDKDSHEMMCICSCNQLL